LATGISFQLVALRPAIMRHRPNPLVCFHACTGHMQSTFVVAMVEATLALHLIPNTTAIRRGHLTDLVAVLCGI